MSGDLLEVVKDGVATLTLNRPDRLNAMSRAMLDGLEEHLDELKSTARQRLGRHLRRHDGRALSVALAVATAIFEACVLQHPDLRGDQVHLLA